MYFVLKGDDTLPYFFVLKRRRLTLLCINPFTLESNETVREAKIQVTPNDEMYSQEVSLSKLLLLL
jgi:hypothetical protein